MDFHFVFLNQTLLKFTLSLCFSHCLPFEQPQQMFPSQEEILQIVNQFGVETCTMRIIRQELEKKDLQFTAHWEDPEWKSKLETMVIEAADLVNSQSSSSIEQPSTSTGNERRTKRIQKSAKQKKKRSLSQDPEAAPKSNPFNEPMRLSNALSEFLNGKEECSRPQTVKHLWNYIKEHQLQDPKDRKYIMCDEKMRALFKTPRVHMFTMNKLLSSHLYPKE